MPGVSLRDLLCCSAKDGDRDDSKPPQIPPADPKRTLEAEKTSGEVAVNEIAVIRGSKGVAATEGSVKAINDGDAASEVPAAIQGTIDAPADDENGPVQRIKAWFNAKNGRDGVVTALEAARLALESASGVLGALSVPGADFSISVVLSIIDNVQTSIENVKTLNDLRDLLSSLSFVVLVPLSRTDKSSSLSEHLSRFKEQIDEQSKKLAVWGSSSRIVRFLNAKVDEGVLSDFSRGVDNAIKKFQLVLDIETAIAISMQGEILNSIKNRLDVIESKMDSRDTDELLKQLIREDVHTAAADYQRKVECCHDKTCERILDKIKSWATDVEAKEGQVFWLSGLAGMGKSTIAKTIAEWARDEGILGSKYFFSRENEKLGEASFIFPNIAYDIAEFDPSVKEIIAGILKKDRRIVYTSETIAKQFQSLVAQPLAEISSRTLASPRKLMLLIVDSLDECSNRLAVKEIVRHLLNFLDGSNPHIRVLLTSRPELYIRDAFGNRVERGFINYNVEDFADPRDIENYLYDGLSEAYDDLEWRERHDFKSLVEYSGKLFIYASTALRYICNESSFSDPEKRMADLLGLSILEQAIGVGTKADSPEMLRLRKILGAIIQLSDPLPINALAEVLEIDESRLRKNLEGLSSVIVVPASDKPSTPVGFFHPSFPDFLKDQQRCTDRFLVDVSGVETFLARRCLEIMVVGLPGNSTVRSPLLNLRYACTNWAGHLTKACHEDAQVKYYFERFIRDCLRDWTKVMKTLLPGRIMHPLILSLETAREWAVRDHRCGTKLSSNGNDSGAVRMQ
ncbi:hypothetical protein SCHPADRAFT_508880 [Schizopora paradoxa]|uniref:NACHT domain-containing protein n=1 Tax=Schizopora paradoxa TaxID=27342 RepID=A0A0H2S0S6_9AGAM|nr:hypothetical protein SCHPADRAFT_508880 [Schizopora paradoxa]